MFLRRFVGARVTRARHGNKPRAGGTAASAYARAYAAIGGVRAVEAATQIKAARLYEAADPDVTPGGGTRKPIGYHEACSIAAAGGVALVEHIAACAGGVFQPLAADDGRPLAELEAELIRAAGAFAAARVAGDRRGADRALDDLVAFAGAVRARCGGPDLGSRP